MRRWLALSTCPMLLLAACTFEDGRLAKDGIGTDLATAGVPDAAHSEDAYIAALCREAGAVTQGGFCEPAGLRDWTALVQAGMNDIDRRCDAYLAWLDAKRRWTAPILQQIGDTATATEAIMAISDVGVGPIAIVGMAFGLARNTFTNLQSRLLLEVDHSTVQTIVLTRQTSYRSSLAGKTVRNRPEAIYALRQYLRICMPFTIETEINNTITAFERGGPAALDLRAARPLVSAVAVGTPSVPLRAARPLGSAMGVGTPSVPLRAAAPIPPTRGPKVAALGGTTPASQVLDRADVLKIQGLLCAEETGVLDDQTKLKVQIFQLYRRLGNTSGTLEPDDIRLLLSEVAAGTKCDRTKFRNYYERVILGTTEDVRVLQHDLNTWPAGGSVDETGMMDAATRQKIADVRGATDSLRETAELSQQVTPRFRLAIRKPH